MFTWNSGWHVHCHSHVHCRSGEEWLERRAFLLTHTGRQEPKLFSHKRCWSQSRSSSSRPTNNKNSGWHVHYRSHLLVCATWSQIESVFTEWNTRGLKTRVILKGVQRIRTGQCIYQDTVRIPSHILRWPIKNCGPGLKSVQLWAQGFLTESHWQAQAGTNGVGLEEQTLLVLSLCRGSLRIRAWAKWC